MNHDHSAIIRFFRTCYQADNREQTIWDIFSNKHEFQRILTKDEIGQFKKGVPVKLPAEFGRNLDYAVNTYRREKTLLAGGMFVAGRISGISSFSSSSKKLCAPLILFEVSLETSGKSVSFTVDPDSYRWNTGLISQLIENREEIHDLEMDIPVESSMSLDSRRIGTWIQSREGENRIVSINDGITGEEELKSASRRQKRSGLVLMNGMALILSARSRASRGIIDELDVISGNDEVSGPLNQLLFKQSVSAQRVRSSQPDNVPGILSNVQETALGNASSQVMSLLIGPPGTGKSYTIACIALERFLSGESVLIVSQNEHAVDVIQEKLVRQLGVSGNAILRAGSSDYHKYLITYIENLTKGIGLEPPGKSLKQELEHIRKTIRNAEKRFETISKKAVSDGVYLDSVLKQSRVGWFQQFRLWHQKKRLKKFGTLHHQLDTIQKAYAKREELLALHINNSHTVNIHKTLTEHRTELVSFLSGLKARTSSRQEKMFSSIDYSILLKAMPVWLCSIASLSKALPLKQELFDLVIIDEATQCDVASCIPALYRAKRAVIVGDPKQLRHVSFLSRQKQELIRTKLQLDSTSVELNFRDNSMIDFADQSITSQSAVTMLDEHYRSLPEIIRFSNQRFYDNALRIMTEKPLQIAYRPVEVIPVAGGERIRGINSGEVDAVMSKLKELVASQETVPPEFKVSIGVVSFFRDQAEALQKQLLDTLPMEAVAAHKLRAGTPYAFQGEERDIMLLSSGVGPDEKGATWHYLNRPDVFNVAVTRARHSQYVFLSAKEAELPETTLMKAYIDSIRKYERDGVHTPAHRDANIDDLALELNRQGITVLREFPVAGVTMDLVVTTGVHAMAIDVIGFPGEYQDVFHLDRYKIFERAGLKIFPLSYTSWRYNRGDVIEQISAELEAMKDAGQTITVTAESLTSHWHKLLAINPELAKKVRTIELSLSSFNLDGALKQSGILIERYQTFLRILREKLNPGELTWSRYVSAAEQVLLGGLDNLNRIVLLKQSLPEPETRDENGDDDICEPSDYRVKQAAAIDSLLELNEEAITRLEAITLEWSRTDTKNGEASMSLESSLKEIERLTESVRCYSR